MRDLRRRALESHKTVSRKARSRVPSTISSQANSTTASPVASRAASRSRNPSQQVSDDEDYLSDGGWSNNSIDEILNCEDVEIPDNAWRAELNVRVEQIVNLKRSTTEGRAESLNAYAHILMARFAKDEIEAHLHELVPSMLRSIRLETTEREALNALKALAVTVASVQSESIYDDVADPLKRSIQSSSFAELKAEAIHALGTAAFFGGAGDEEIIDIMTLFLEIIESDGASIDAQDEGDVVTAALEEWGLLATEIEDLEEQSESAVDAFVEQLESSNTAVQIAAGENIALLYEKSFTAREQDEEASEEDSVDNPEYQKGSEKMVKRYQVYRRQDQLLLTLDQLANLSTRRISKRDRKTLHASFVDIRNSVEKPTRGPGYSTAIDRETGKAYGARMKIGIMHNLEIRIDKWWKLHRLNSLRRILQGGFKHHYDQNQLVSTTLPFSMATGRW